MREKVGIESGESVDGCLGKMSLAGGKRNQIQGRAPLAGLYLSTGVGRLFSEKKISRVAVWVR